jgi:hypothetical protein
MRIGIDGTETLSLDRLPAARPDVTMLAAGVDAPDPLPTGIWRSLMKFFVAR